MRKRWKLNINLFHEEISSSIEFSNSSYMFELDIKRCVHNYPNFQMDFKNKVFVLRVWPTRTFRLTIFKRK